MTRDIASLGTLREHYERNGWNYDIFVLLAEANWDVNKRQYNGISTMARVLKLSDFTVDKHLKVYDKEIGRTRNDENKQ